MSRMGTGAYLVDDDGRLLCPMPDCDEELRLVVTTEGGFTIENGRPVSLMDGISRWEVACIAGHIVLLPDPSQDEDAEWQSDLTYGDDDTERLIDDEARLASLYGVTPLALGAE